MLKNIFKLTMGRNKNKNWNWQWDIQYPLWELHCIRVTHKVLSEGLFFFYFTFLRRGDIYVYYALLNDHFVYWLFCICGVILRLLCPPKQSFYVIILYVVLYCNFICKCNVYISDISLICTSSTLLCCSDTLISCWNMSI